MNSSTSYAGHNDPGSAVPTATTALAVSILCLVFCVVILLVSCIKYKKILAQQEAEIQELRRVTNDQEYYVDHVSRKLTMDMDRVNETLGKLMKPDDFIELKAKTKCTVLFTELKAKTKCTVLFTELKAKTKCTVLFTELKAKTKCTVLFTELKAKTKCTVLFTELKAKTKCTVLFTELKAKTKFTVLFTELKAKTKFTVLFTELKAKTEHQEELLTDVRSRVSEEMNADIFLLTMKMKTVEDRLLTLEKNMEVFQSQPCESHFDISFDSSKLGDNINIFVIS
ncbi:hypothetical protein Btru_045620 [Bulinus truncatus]|nr:hypothetical protein Btru_045620 [Bulinus truncatus]